MTDTNDLLDAHFEEQRIHDLKIDVDKVAEAIEDSETNWRHDGDDNCDNCRKYCLVEELKWFKTLL